MKWWMVFAITAGCAALSYGWYGIGYDQGLGDGRRDVLKVWNESLDAAKTVTPHVDQMQVQDAPITTGTGSVKGFKLTVTGCFQDGSFWKPRGTICYAKDKP